MAGKSTAFLQQHPGSPVWPEQIVSGYGPPYSAAFRKAISLFSVRAGPQSLAMQKPQNHVRKPAGSGRSLDSQRERPVFGIPRIPGPGRTSNATRSIHPSCRYRPQRMEGIIASIRTGYAALPSHKICNFPEKERFARKAMLLALRCGRFYRLWQLSSSQAFRLSPPQNTPSFVSVKSRKAPFDAFLLLTPAVCLPLPP